MKAAAINDLSGFGKCSLAADISVLSAMGIQACPMPTAVLTAQTGYTGYFCRDLTGDLPEYLRHWSELNERFDGILTGFFLNERQAELALDFAGRFHKDSTVLLVDPVMADHGRTFVNYSGALLENLRLLAARADILTPNISELCLLAGKAADFLEPVPTERLGPELEKLAGTLINRTGKSVVVTGVPVPGERIGNLIVDRTGAELLDFPAVPGGYSGTGDLLAAAVLGGVLGGNSLRDAVSLAGKFVAAAVRDAWAEGQEANAGTGYEKHLFMLMEGRENR